MLTSHVNGDDLWTSWAAGNGVSHVTLRRLAQSWPRRTAIRADVTALDTLDRYDPAVPDYPAHLVPFAEHPLFLAASPEQRQRVLTGLWLGYNERVIETERLIAEPAFDLIMRGRFPGGDHPVVRLAIQQAVVDESFHTYMHMLAIARTMELRGLRSRPRQPILISYRRLRDALASVPARWERDLAVLVWGAVAETCINALLALIARDRDVQPLHALITTLHLRDESAHGAIVTEVVKALYEHMNAERRRAFSRYLPLALQAFTEQDLSVLRVELAHAGVVGADEIVGDLRRGRTGVRLVRDYSGARRMVRELGLSETIEFDFPAPPEWAADVSPDLPVPAPAGERR